MSLIHNSQRVRDRTDGGDARLLGARQRAAEAETPATAVCLIRALTRSIARSADCRDEFRPRNVLDATAKNNMKPTLKLFILLLSFGSTLVAQSDATFTY